MLQNNTLAKRIGESSWNQLLWQLKYKAERENKAYYPSSQECSRCGNKNKQVKNLQIREWECPKGGGRT